MTLTMSLSKAIKGATKPKYDEYAKDKYIENIQEYLSNNSGKSDVAQFLDILKPRLSNDIETSAFSNISFKSHILLHQCLLLTPRDAKKYQIWDGIAAYQKNNTLLPLVDHKLSHSSPDYRLSSAYSRYLSQRIHDFDKLELDTITEKKSNTSVVDNASSANIDSTSSGLLDQAQAAMIQLRLGMDCLFSNDMLELPAFLQCYQLLAVDMATLFKFLNLAIVLALQNFFSLARPDAERTLFIYKEFTQLQISEDVSSFVSLAANGSTKEDLDIPTPLKQSQKSICELTKALESYLFSSSQVQPTEQEEKQEYEHEPEQTEESTEDLDAEYTTASRYLTNNSNQSKDSFNSYHIPAPSFAESIPETISSSVYSANSPYIGGHDNFSSSSPSIPPQTPTRSMQQHYQNHLSTIPQSETLATIKGNSFIDENFSSSSNTSLSPITSEETKYLTNNSNNNNNIGRFSDYTYRSSSVASTSSLDVSKTPTSSINGPSPITPPNNNNNKNNNSNNSKVIVNTSPLIETGDNDNSSSLKFNLNLPIKNDEKIEKNNDWINEMFDSLVETNTPSLDLDTSNISLSSFEEEDSKPLPPPPSTLHHSQSMLHIKTKNIFKAFRKTSA